MQEKVRGIILSHFPIGEYDKRVVILTDKKGKISAFAKNARRQKSPLTAKTNPLILGEFDIYFGNKSNSINDIKLIDDFSYFSSNLKAANLAFYFIEFMDYYTNEMSDELDMLKLLYVSLTEITKNKLPLNLIRYIFIFKALVILGEYPNMDEFINNKDKDPSFYLDPNNNTITTSKSALTIPVRTSTLKMLDYLINTDIKNLYAIDVKPRTLNNFCDIINVYFNKNHYNNFNSLKYLD